VFLWGKFGLLLLGMNIGKSKGFRRGSRGGGRGGGYSTRYKRRRFFRLRNVDKPADDEAEGTREDTLGNKCVSWKKMKEKNSTHGNKGESRRSRDRPKRQGGFREALEKGRRVSKGI